MDDTARTARLPAWARNKIHGLQASLAAAEAKLAAGPQDSDTFADPYTAARRPLGRGTMVLFGTPDDPATFTAELHGGALKVLVTKRSGRSEPAILALSSNYFLIKVVDAS